jgi:hypothetical protein
MLRRNLITCFALIATAIPVTSSAANPFSNPLMATLTSKLGITQDQAEGGVGSMLTLAQEKLAKGDFDKIASVIPGASKYLDKAKSLGAVTGALGNGAGLTGAFSKLGINSETAAKFVPMVTKFVGKTGGKDLGTKFATALK